MSEYEIADLAESILSNYLATFTILLSLITTYVITAFVAGARLSKLQVVVVNLSFLTSTSMIAFLSLQLFQRATVMAQKSAAQFGTAVAPFDFSGVLALLYLGLLVGAIAFMTSVRREAKSK